MISNEHPTNLGLEKLDAVYFKGGEMPVILGNGFGAVIFHEACGHGLEATSIAPKVSVFKDDLNKNIKVKIKEISYPYCLGERI